MRLKITTRLSAGPERVWAEVQKSKLLLHVAAPLLVFRPVSDHPVPDEFPEGRLRVWMLLFGFLPLGRQWIDVSRPDLGDGVKRIRDNGSGDLIQTWDHWIAIAPHPEGGTAYCDEVEIKAGVLTPLIWAFAWCFYSWRQHRWRALVARDFRY
jgi:hypothetical protein